MQPPPPQFLLLFLLLYTFGSSEGEAEETAFTKKDNGCRAVLKAKRPALVVSSTSWTGQ